MLTQLQLLMLTKTALKCIKLHWQFHKIFWWIT